MVDKKLEYTENWRLSNTNPTKNRKWNQVLHSILQFLLHWYHIMGVGADKLPSTLYFILKNGFQKSLIVPCPLKLGLSKKKKVFLTFLNLMSISIYIISLVMLVLHVLVRGYYKWIPALITQNEINVNYFLLVWFLDLFLFHVLMRSKFSIHMYHMIKIWMLTSTVWPIYLEKNIICLKNTDFNRLIY